jgi:hypothetical protein
LRPKIDAYFKGKDKKYEASTVLRIPEIGYTIVFHFEKSESTENVYNLDMQRYKVVSKTMFVMVSRYDPDNPIPPTHPYCKYDKKNTHDAAIIKLFK